MIFFYENSRLLLVKTRNVWNELTRWNVAGCGGRFKAPSGVLQSPNYPENYDRLSDCGWLIEVLANHVVELTFVDFALEPHPNCTNGYVAVSWSFKTTTKQNAQSEEIWLSFVSLVIFDRYQQQ